MGGLVLCAGPACGQAVRTPSTQKIETGAEMRLARGEPQTSKDMADFVVGNMLFVLLHASGDPALVLAGPQSDPAVIAALHHRLGLDQPLGVQYAEFLRGAIHLSFGDSYLFNSAALLEKGGVGPLFHKTLLPTYDVFDESRYFQPAHSQHTFALNASKLGITICEDCWNDKNFWAQRLYDRDPVAELVAQGSNLILNISASPYTIDKRSLRHDMLRAIAIERRFPVVYVNQVGGNDSLIFDGSSMAFTADGRVGAMAKSCPQRRSRST